VFFKIDAKAGTVIVDEENCYPKTEEAIAERKADTSSAGAATWKTRVYPALEAALEGFAKEPRYIVINIAKETEGEGVRDVLTFINWCPDRCNVRAKMLAGGSAIGVNSQMEGVQKKISAQDLSDVEYDALLEAVGL
jgi:hypothetical protein